MLVWISRLLGLAFVAVGATLLITWATSDDPKFNPASFEDAPFAQSIASPDVATTLAQYRAGDGTVVTLLVERQEGDHVIGIDLSDLGAASLVDPFAVLASLDESQLRDAMMGPFDRQTVKIADLLPTGSLGSRHLGIGTNFPEHAEESNSSSVFNFPKFGTATPARTTVSAAKGGLLDYEVELCMRFDRAIATLDDFDAAVKGVFLCADFTDRIAILELADPDNLDSGYGFSDAKSGPGFFPTGPFLVIPYDWSAFIDETRMMTHHNGVARQDARGEEMTLDFRQLTEKVLADMEEPRFFYDGAFYKLAPSGQIDQDMTLMSGTSEGVIFTAPARHDYIEMALAYAMAGGPWSDKDLMDIAIPVFVENEVASGHFLQPGDTVRYQASNLGDIVVEITD
ncbi:MAG: fumarylacetoacetate hydrolase family protein [Pseudomonadota bacterium]